MANKRILCDGGIYHAVTRCNNREPLFQEERDFKKYLHFVKKYKNQFGFKLFNYTLMSSHSHLILMTLNNIPLSKIMHCINWHFSIWYNKAYQRKGHFWEERFYCEYIANDRYLLACSRYLDLNPVAAGIVKKPEQWPYSTYLAYAKGVKNELVDFHPSYSALGSTNKERQEAYCALFPCGETDQKLQ